MAGNASWTKKTLLAGVAQTVVPLTRDLRGVRVLNWTASPVYLALGLSESGVVPASGAPSDVVPAAAAGLPGQYEAPFAPKQGLTALGASAGDLTVAVW